MFTSEVLGHLVPQEVRVSPGRLHVALAGVWRLNPADSKREILVARRRMGDTLGGFWELPGGKIEQSEESLAAAMRELREETGLVIAAERWHGPVEIPPPAGRSWPHFHLWIAQAGAEAAPQPLESEQCRWVSALQLIELEFPEANRRVTALLAARIETFVDSTG